MKLTPVQPSPQLMDKLTTLATKLEQDLRKLGLDEKQLVGVAEAMRTYFLGVQDAQLETQATAEDADDKQGWTEADLARIVAAHGRGQTHDGA